VRDCPTPLKRWYHNKAAAKRAHRRIPSQSRDAMHAYRCRCGGFHIGHKPGLRVR
jgi:hypothetical protein